MHVEEESLERVIDFLEKRNCCRRLNVRARKRISAGNKKMWLTTIEDHKGNEDGSKMDTCVGNTNSKDRGEKKEHRFWKYSSTGCGAGVVLRSILEILKKRLNKRTSSLRIGGNG